MGNKINYRKVKEKDLEEIAKVHIVAFPDYFLTTFGKELILEFYKKFYENKNIFVVAEYDCEIIGFILGNNSTIPRKKFFRDNFLKICIRVFFQMLKGNSILWKGIISRLCFVKEAFRSKIKIDDKKDIKNSYRLLSIAIFPKYRGENIAFNMENYFVLSCIENNFSEIGLSVKNNNSRAIKFYKKCGYKIEKEEKNTICFSKTIRGEKNEK